LRARRLQVAAGDVLADVQTDKATMAFESQEDGWLARILVPAGEGDIPVGAPVAVMARARAYAARRCDALTDLYAHCTFVLAPCLTALPLLLAG
jgi:pyruvate/2-oxoglutarate dehydrogenase complex dihydrolipoamide acyltransferase (E2) component